MGRDSLDFLKSGSFYAIYTICRTDEDIQGWIDVFKVFCLDNAARLFDGSDNCSRFKSYHETSLLKYWEAKYILNNKIHTDLFFCNPSFYDPINQKSDFDIECYSKHIRKRAFYLGSYLWALSGAFDMLKGTLNIFSKVNCSIYFEFSWEQEEWFKQFELQRNLFTHNPYFFHVIKGNQQYLLRLNKARLEPAEAEKIIKNYNEIGNDEGIMDKTIIEYCDDLHEKTTSAFSRAYSDLLEKGSNQSPNSNRNSYNTIPPTSTACIIPSVGDNRKV